MRAAVYYSVGDVRVQDIEEPAAGPGQVKLRVSYNGLCGTDLHEVFDTQRAIPATPHPLTGVEAPVVLGHEIAGTVVEVGQGVSTVEPGDLVAVEPLVTCGQCPSCRAGDRHLCDRLAFHGLSTLGGGLAEYTVVAASMLHAIPDGVEPASAAMAEPLAVAWHAVERSGVRPGHEVAVLGGGPIGLGIFLTLRIQGVDAIVVEPAPHRREVAAAFGARTVDPGSGPVASQVLQMTGGRGVDVCFETSAVVASLEAALGATAKHGVVMMLASPRAPLPAVLGQALARELEIRTSYAYHNVFPKVIEAITAGLYPMEGWVTVSPLSELDQALAGMRSGQTMKVLVDPSR
jgi:(R,R)-butanediol dehydrogenase/meso-butanediol dehydrogenase/diacetyl reductase